DDPLPRRGPVGEPPGDGVERDQVELRAALPDDPGQAGHIGVGVVDSREEDVLERERLPGRLAEGAARLAQPRDREAAGDRPPSVGALSAPARSGGPGSPASRSIAGASPEVEIVILRRERPNPAGSTRIRNAARTAS